MQCGESTARLRGGAPLAHARRPRRAGCHPAGQAPIRFVLALLLLGIAWAFASISMCGVDRQHDDTPMSGRRSCLIWPVARMPVPRIVAPSAGPREAFLHARCAVPRHMVLMQAAADRPARRTLRRRLLLDTHQGAADTSPLKRRAPRPTPPPLPQCTLASALAIARRRRPCPHRGAARRARKRRWSSATTQPTGTA